MDRSLSTVDSSPALPTELIVIIVSIAATQDLPTAACLCLVSKWVRGEVEPILYRVLSLRNVSAEEAVQKLYSTKFHTFAQYMCLIDIRRNSKLSKRPRGNSIAGIRNLAIDTLPYKKFIDGSTIEELLILPSLPWVPWACPQLQRVHLPVIDTFPLTSIDNILKHPRLTHVALSIREDYEISDPTSWAARLLREHKPLVLLFVRLMPSISVVPHGIHNDIVREPLVAKLASLGDPRLVVKHTIPFGNGGWSGMVNEWERHTRSGESIWGEVQPELCPRPSIVTAS